MPSKVVIGTQFGDEGKGKIVDMLAEDADMIVRFNGGANAGHTLVANGEKTILHLLPSGILYPGKTNIVGPSVLCDPEVITDELKIAKAHNSVVMLDPDAPVITPLHKQMDALREMKLETSLGTTQRGIGPCMEDVVARRGLRLGDLAANADEILSRINARGFYSEKATLLKEKLFPIHTAGQLVEWFLGFARLEEHMRDTRSIIHGARAHEKRLLFEGAQGVLLDPNFAIPFSTSSLCTPAGISSSFGIYGFDEVVGVAKAYMTRVGRGPFPTKVNGEIEQRLRESGNEFGSTTGRARDTGWLDLPLLKFACRVGGITKLALTKLDILSSFKKIPVCVKYKSEANYFSLRTLNTRVLEKAEPEYQELPGWDQDISKCRYFDDLPTQAQDYVRFVETYIRVPISMISVGPGRNDIIRR